MITDEYYIKVKRRIKSILTRYRLLRYYEDFTHDYFVLVLEGKVRKQTLNQFVVDNLRRRTTRGAQTEERTRELYGTQRRYTDIVKLK
jgi:hypothetical protein